MLLLMTCSGNRPFLYEPAPVERNLSEYIKLGKLFQANGIV